MLSVAPKDGPDGHIQLHASTVTLDGKAIAFVGPSGSGKSSHALAMMSRGAVLLADDITWLSEVKEGLMASCPPTIQGRIEARGVGILSAPMAPPSPLCLIVDLGMPEAERLPAAKSVVLLGHLIPVLHTAATPYFIDAVRHYIQHGYAS